jgi:hypothetical protein
MRARARGVAALSPTRDWTTTTSHTTMSSARSLPWPETNGATPWRCSVRERDGAALPRRFRRGEEWGEVKGGIKGMA